MEIPYWYSWNNIATISNDKYEQWYENGIENHFQSTKRNWWRIWKKEGTVFVIFDDNISGGSTLSDICYQAKKLGIKYIIPITFGEMRVKYQQGTLAINAPEKWNY